MPKISSFNYDKRRLADDYHRNDPSGNAKRDKIYHYCRACVASMNRDISYKDIAKATGMEIGQVRFHFRKLVAVGAISLQDDH